MFCPDNYRGFDMSNGAVDGVNTLTFDLFGTVLDLAGSLVPRIDEFLAARASPIDGGGVLGAVAAAAARRAVPRHHPDAGDTAAT